LKYELSIIKSFLIYEEWNKWSSKLNVKDLPKELHAVYSVLDNFHQSNTDKINLTVADLSNILFAHKHKDVAYYEGVIETLDKLEVSTQSTNVLLQSFVENKLLKEISLAAYDVTEGRLSKEKFNELLDSFSAEKSIKVYEDEFEFVSDDIEQLLVETFRKPGLRWRLNTLNQMLGSLRGGDFGFIFARPETGKTTFLASETTFMAEQLSEESGPIIWLNNEEKGSKVKIRCYQASLGASLAAINSNPVAARNAYMKKTKGKHMILNPAGSISKTMVERICKQYKPSLLIFDQIDKIVGFEADREDLKLGAMYQWARELAKEHDCAVIGVCQADGSGEGQKWLTMGNVANAKTAKQAEADWIVGIGKVADVGYENLRYLNASKNKLAGDEDTDPTMRHGKREVLIKAEVARYEDII
jgi:replicative DNA helicase